MGKGELAEELFLKGYNCAQAVAGAFAEDIGMDFDTAVKTVSSFGGGMGRLREVCGAVSGMFFVAGALYGYWAEKFKEQTGSIVCRELLGAEGKDAGGAPLKRTEEYYQKRPCPKMVFLAADIMETYKKDMEKRGGIA